MPAPSPRTETGQPLDEMLCVALYSASRAMTARYRPLLSALGLTCPQYLVMLALWEDGQASVGRLGERLRLDSGTLSPLLRRMEQAGLVTRSRSLQDERSTNVTLTDAGRDLRTRAAGIPAVMCAATGLDAAQQHELVAALGVLEERLFS